MMNFAPGAKMLAIAVNNTAQTIFPAGVTRIIVHDFFLSSHMMLYSYNPSGDSLEPADYHISLCWFERSDWQIPGLFAAVWKIWTSRY